MSKKLGLPLEYNKLSEFFDSWNTNTDNKNALIEKILSEYGVKSVFDMTCGTGSQVFFLKKLCYDVVGSDISQKLIEIARKKDVNKNIKFIEGDMRKIKLNHGFDSVITIFNAIGHLTKSGFEKAIRNINHNLKDSGIYVFDIFNLDAMSDDIVRNFACYVHKTLGEYQFLSTQCSTIDREKGILTSYDTHMIQKNSEKPEIFNSKFSLQIYSINQLDEMLKRNGFDIVKTYDINGNNFVKETSSTILTIARKKQ